MTMSDHRNSPYLQPNAHGEMVFTSIWVLTIADLAPMYYDTRESCVWALRQHAIAMASNGAAPKAVLDMLRDSTKTTESDLRLWLRRVHKVATSMQARDVWTADSRGTRTLRLHLTDASLRRQRALPLGETGHTRPADSNPDSNKEHES